jgi:hypothetical protein
MQSFKYESDYNFSKEQGNGLVGIGLGGLSEILGKYLHRGITNIGWKSISS